MHKSIHYNLYCLRLIRRYIPLPIAITIASSYIIPLFDYFNPYSLTSRTTNSSNSDSKTESIYFPDVPLTPLFLKQLHWLQVPYRIKYKLSLTIHKAIHHNSPDYLASLLHLHTPITTLHTRSSKTFILTTPHFYKLHYSNIRSFALSAPYYWNSLPKHLRINSSTPSYKRHLKTHYFSLAFPPTK